MGLIELSMGLDFGANHLAGAVSISMRHDDDDVKIDICSKAAKNSHYIQNSLFHQINTQY